MSIWRYARVWCTFASGLLMVASLLVVGARPARADQTLDWVICVSANSSSSGSLSATTNPTTWLGDTGLSWAAANLDPHCLNVPLGLIGPGFAQTIPPSQRSGNTWVTPMFSGTWILRLGGLGNSLGTKDLATLDITVNTPGPLTGGETEVFITDNSIAQRRTFVSAVQTQNVTARIAGDVNLDLSGLSNVRIASGVRIIGDRTVFAAGPRLFTTTFPSKLFTIGDPDTASDNVRITGIRLDGGASANPFDSVGMSGAAGISVFSSVDVEIDHNEVYRWRGSGIGVFDGDTVGRNILNRDNATEVSIHDNYIHHNQHPSSNVCGSGPLDGGGHSAGYGVLISGGAYALVERNVFDGNRHAIAGDGSQGSGYLFYRNLILTGGGEHFRCVDLDPSWTWVINPFWVPVALIFTDDGIYHTHAIDMHGVGTCPGLGFFPRGDHNCGAAGEYMDIEYNTILYTNGNGIHLRGTPTVRMDVKFNWFAHEEQWGGIGGGNLPFTPGAMVQNESGLVDFGNAYGVNHFNERKFCDFDGDGTNDPLIATGVTWWYQSSAVGRWVYLHQSPTLIANISVADVNGDGYCDATAGGQTVFATPTVLRVNAVADRSTVVGSPTPGGGWVQFTLSRGTGPVTWSAGGLPSGVTLNPTTGVLTGAPTQSGTHRVRYTATDQFGNTSTRVFTWTITPMAVQPFANRNDPVGASGFWGQFAVSSGTAPFTWSANGIPPGVTLNPATGALTGTLTQTGIHIVSYRATDQFGNFATGVFQWTVAIPVPNVNGMSWWSAVSALEGAGLTVVQGGTIPTDAIDAAGTVFSQTPSPGTHVMPGTQVSLTLWRFEPNQCGEFAC
ncbi:MAG TPA: putative Ig domain-containing protein [Candidatus Limnocylindrales bacterium]|nr:putative Ig domain-containing protein [Candidatus Limnocylindrales bacterium]